MLKFLARIAAFAILLTPAHLVAQSPLAGVDMSLPKMTEANLSRAEVQERLAAATDDAPADFTRQWLNGLDLSGLDFTRAILRAASMNGTNLSKARLDGAILSQAWMLDANLSGASLIRAELFQTQLGRADLTGANFTGARAAADFSRARLDGAIFRNADFSADMRNQSMGLMRGVLKSARGEGVDFTGARMSRADLEFAKLPGARLTDVDLSMATLGGADLTGADVTGANFHNADVTSTRLKNLTGVRATNLEAAKNLARAFR